MVSSNEGHPNQEEWLSWIIWVLIDLNILRCYVPATRRWIRHFITFLNSSVSATSWALSYCGGVFVQQATFWLARLAGATEFVEEQADCNLLSTLKSAHCFSCNFAWYQAWYCCWSLALPKNVECECHLKISCSFLCLWTILCFAWDLWNIGSVTLIPCKRNSECDESTNQHAFEV